MSIEFTDYNLYYGDFHAIKDVSMVIPTEEVTAFIGPSGSGKSTILKSINRMNDYVSNVSTNGSIEINGRDIYDKNWDVNDLRRDVGMVFQQPNPFKMSIYDNIAYGPRTHGIKDKYQLDQIVEDSLKKAAIWNEVKNKLTSSALSLSGGQQQRVCIARALSVEPQILLMDEPTSALDPISTGKIEELIQELKKEYTIVIVTHNMAQASRTSDNTAFFVLGELIEFNETYKLFSSPQHHETEQYITGRFG